MTFHISEICFHATGLRTLRKSCQKSIKSWIKNRNILFLFKNITVLEKRNAGGVKKEWRKNNDNMHKD